MGAVRDRAVDWNPMTVAALLRALHAEIQWDYNMHNVRAVVTRRLLE